MSEFRTIDAPYGGLGRRALADWGAIAKALKELPHGKALELTLPAKTKGYTLYQALRGKQCAAHIKPLDTPGTFAVWERRNGKDSA
jgi:hypothetical protein